jgi:hypothetical protein
MKTCLVRHSSACRSRGRMISRPPLEIVRSSISPRSPDGRTKVLSMERSLCDGCL